MAFPQKPPISASITLEQIQSWDDTIDVSIQASKDGVFLIVGIRNGNKRTSILIGSDAKGRLLIDSLERALNIVSRAREWHGENSVSLPVSE